MTSLDVARELRSRYSGSMEKMLRDVLKVRDSDTLALKASSLLGCEPDSLAALKTDEQWEPVVKKLIHWKMIDRGMMKQAKIDDGITAEQLPDGRWEVSVKDGFMKEMASLYGEMMNEAAGRSAGNIVEAAAAAFSGFAEQMRKELQNMPKRKDDLSKLKSRGAVIANAVRDAKSMKLGPRAAALVESLTPKLTDFSDGIKELDALKTEDMLKKSDADAKQLADDKSLSKEERAEKLKQITQGADAALSEYEELFKKMSELCDELEQKARPLIDALRSRR